MLAFVFHHITKYIVKNITIAIKISKYYKIIFKNKHELNLSSLRVRSRVIVHLKEFQFLYYFFNHLNTQLFLRLFEYTQF